MATAPSSCLRGSPQLLTRTWLITPSYLHYQCPRNSIKRSLDPYRVSYTSHRMSTPTRRSFHSTKRFGKNIESAIPHISLHIAASSSGKGMKYDAEKNTIDFDPSKKNALGLQAEGNVYARRRGRPDSGEDAYFVSSVSSDPNIVAMGVCDGVGGWSEQGINPADFSHGMCSYMAQSALNWPKSDEDNQIHPKKLMNIGYDSTLKDNQIRAGGATACVAVADNNGRIRTANLGDSGFVLLRLGSVHQYSTPQTHAFNTPYQMSKTPPEIMTQAAIFGGLPLNDAPDRADVADDQLQHGDVMVFATDGVWDNLSSQDILAIVSRLMRDKGAWQRSDEKGTIVTDQISQLVQPSTGANSNSKDRSLQSVIASHIVGEAKVASQDRKRDGPFAKAVQREYPLDRWHGGKVDDITAIVLIAVENNGASGDGEQLKAKL